MLIFSSVGRSSVKKRGPKVAKNIVIHFSTNRPIVFHCDLMFQTLKQNSMRSLPIIS